MIFRKTIDITKNYNKWSRVKPIFTFYIFVSLLVSANLFIIRINVPCFFFCFCCHLEWFSRTESQTWVTWVIKSYTNVCLQRRIKELFTLYISEIWHLSRLLVSFKYNGSKSMPEKFELFYPIYLIMGISLIFVLFYIWKHNTH